MKTLYALFVLMMSFDIASAQSYLLTLTDSTLLDHIDTLGDGSTQPRFVDPNMDAATNAPNIIQFNQCILRDILNPSSLPADAL